SPRVTTTTAVAHHIWGPLVSTSTITQPRAVEIAARNGGTSRPITPGALGPGASSGGSSRRRPWWTAPSGPSPGRGSVARAGLCWSRGEAGLCWSRGETGASRPEELPGPPGGVGWWRPVLGAGRGVVEGDETSVAIAISVPSSTSRYQGRASIGQWIPEGDDRAICEREPVSTVRG